MAKTNAKFNEMSVEDLENEENELRTVLFNLRVQNTTKALENVNEIRATRRQLARTLTELRARKLAS